MAKIFIAGAGGFGTALGVMSAGHGHDVTIWSPFAAEVEQLDKDRESKRLLPGVMIPENVEITTSLEAAKSAGLVIFATPSAAVRSAARRLAEVLPRGVAVSCVSKGLEAGTYKTLSGILDEELPQNPNAIVSGPSHAEEVARAVPTTVVAASKTRAVAEYVQDVLMNESFRIYASDDVLGVELGGALKNVIALAAGVLEGFGAGDNTKAALMTRGITEIARLGVALGAKSETFAGLSGIGDLIVTCSSSHSRNRRCGILIGKGTPAKDAVQAIGMTVEGYPCAKAAYELSQKHKITMPIVAETYKVLYEGKAAAQGVKDLMERPKRHESETIWLLSR
jgi:glycerol-3-phosphate dehydrogenase (NAD(P)+)